ncbi:MAG: crossover junction endodeoxyribonuclease RuvC [bacterium]
MPTSTSRTKSSSASRRTDILDRVIGIDPGLGATGYGVIEGERVVEFGVIATDTRESVAERLLVLGRELDLVVRRLQPAACALETLFFKGGGARSVILSAQCRGVILYTLARRAVPVTEVTPATVKLAATGSGRASKPQMVFMVRKVLGLDDRVPEHAADALAAAYCLSKRSRGFPGAGGQVSRASGAWPVR